jgi:hypothetical protein
MKTIEIRSLLDRPKEISIPAEIERYFNLWKYRRDSDVKPLEIFYAGWVMSNPAVKELYNEYERKLKNKK